MREPVEDGGAHDWDYMIKRLEDEEAFWKPGTRNGYHMINFGWTVGELVRRVSGQSLGQFFRQAVADPANAKRRSVRNLCAGVDTNQVYEHTFTYFLCFFYTIRFSCGYLHFARCFMLCRELAFQISEQFDILGKPLNINVSTITGGRGETLI